MLALEEIILHSLNARKLDKFSQSDLSFISSTDHRALFSKYSSQLVHPFLSNQEFVKVNSFIKDFKKSVYEDIIVGKCHRFLNSGYIAIPYEKYVNFLNNVNSESANQETFLYTVWRLGEYSNAILYNKNLKYIPESDYKNSIQKVVLFYNLFTDTKIKGLDSRDAELSYSTEPLILYQGMYLRERDYQMLHEKVSSLLETFREGLKSGV